MGRFNGLTRGFQHTESLWELQRRSQAFTWVRLDYDFAQTASRIRDAGLDATLATRLGRGK